jgi:flagellar protein FliL
MAKGDSETEPRKKSKLPMLLMGLAFLLLLGAAGFFGWQYFVGSSAANRPAAADDESEAAAEEAAHEEEAPADEHGGGEHGGGAAPVSTIVNLEPFLVNLADPDETRYLRVTIRVQLASKSAAQKVGATEVFSSKMRDTILGILSTKVAREVVTPEGKDQLKEEIAQKLNSFLPGKPVVAVFFTDFVVQL